VIPGATLKLTNDPMRYASLNTGLDTLARLGDFQPATSFPPNIAMLPRGGSKMQY